MDELVVPAPAASALMHAVQNGLADYDDVLPIAKPVVAAEYRRMADELDRWAQPGSVLPDPATVHAITARMRRRADELDGNDGGPDRPPVGG